jgi:diketogulonate reductase-like aldo/keto reductase
MQLFLLHGTIGVDMNIPLKTLSNGFALPVYGLGTWEMGGGWNKIDTSNDDVFADAIRSAIDHGITHIDCAELYGGGHAEELIARAKAGLDRKSLTLASKVLTGMDDGYDGVLRACEASLRRLKTDYLDLYMLHRCPDHNLEGIMRALDRLVEEGLVRNIGVSNFTVNRFKTAQSFTTNKIVCNQLHYSLECREIIDRGVLDYSQQNDIIVTAWGPLSKGAMSDAPILHEIADKYGKTPYQIALNWLIYQKNVVVIPKTSSIAHLEENLGALGWSLEQEDWRQLANNFPKQITVSNRVPLDYSAEIEA